ncbi:MAG TPA: Flp pilus assembly protein CpaB [Bryobacteraceae bacterium]|nr:Flp pilus assembly protein CpaB [Bryobacteraceae bacterium]
MDRRVLTVLGASLLLALVISMVFYQMTARASTPKKAEQNDTTRDLVTAARPLGVGTTIKPQDIKLVKIAVSAFPKNGFSKPEEVYDRPVTSPILQDEALLEGRLAARGSGLGLAPIIPVGMRAVTVRVNDVTGVSGFVLPGMRVDVLVTGHPPKTDLLTVTRTTLQNIMVLSAGTSIQADSRGAAIQAPTVTLLASPEQAELLTLANSEGHIQLILRNASDQTVEKTKGAQLTELYGGKGRDMNHSGSDEDQPRARAVAVASPPPPPPPPPPDQVVVIRGTTKTVEVVGSGRGTGR